MNSYMITHGARIVQEVMREEYGMPTELAVQLEWLLVGGAFKLQEAGYEVFSVHVDYDPGSNDTPSAIVRMKPDKHGVSVVFEVRTMLEMEDEQDVG